MANKAEQESRDTKETACLDLCALRTRHPEAGTKRVFRKSKRLEKMSDSAQGQSDHHQPQATVSSNAGYNPLMTGEDQAAGVGGSVVDDLMSVYESMTQSKTPHPNHQQSKPMVQHPQYEHFANPEQQHQMQAPQPHIPQQQAPMVQQYNVPDHVYQQQQQVQAPPIQYQQPPQQMYGGYQNYQQQQYAAPPPAQSYAPLEQQQQMPKPEEVDSDEIEDQPRTRKKRRGSAMAKGRKKGKGSDGRWSKRFTWPDDLHRDFVSAIFDVGLKHSSPSTIIEHMPKNPDITTERIKSHLQKYRLHRQKSKQEFMTSYEASLNKFQDKGLSNVKSLTNADAAAHLTYVATMDPSKAAPPTTHAPPSQEVAVRPGQPVAYAPNVNEALMLPQLTEAEKKTPIGASMGYLMGLFFSLKQQLATQRGLPNTDKMNPAALQTTTVAAVIPPKVTADEITRESTVHVQSVDSVASTCTEETPSSAHPSSRNIEVNTHMKRDMQNQMAFQNKMRALKQQELNKIKKAGDGKDVPAVGQPKDAPPPNGDDEANQGQVAGENGGHDGAQGGAPRNRGISIGGSDEFWNSDVVDDQLFEFLMNH
mmetsp:Transcript_33017/g.79836  ORF Transcript_33017/g.79836 Transcript_33017/m.79836 type:complete len:591 (-) Transcript_33017:99-1871(-)